MHAAARRVVRQFREVNALFMAAGIAFYAMVSLVPLLLVSLALLSVTGMKDRFVAMIGAYLSETGVAVLEGILTSGGPHTLAGGVGLAVAVWSGSRLFRGLSVAFEEIYAEESDLSLLRRVGKSLLAVGVLLLGVLLLSATSVLLAVVDLPVRYPTVVGNLVAVVVLAIAFLPVFYLMPPVSVSLRHALPGTILSASGWVLLQVAFFYYAGVTGRYAAYGLLGAILLFITFLYFGAALLLVGAILNVVLDRG